MTFLSFGDFSSKKIIVQWTYESSRKHITTPTDIMGIIW
jgi:hypothetical protein